MKTFKEKINALEGENTSIKAKQKQTKQIILTLEQKNDQLKILQDTHCDQVNELALPIHRKCTQYVILFGNSHFTD